METEPVGQFSSTTSCDADYEMLIPETLGNLRFCHCLATVANNFFTSDY